LTSTAILSPVSTVKVKLDFNGKKALFFRSKSIILVIGKPYFLELKSPIVGERIRHG